MAMEWLSRRSELPCPQTLQELIAVFNIQAKWYLTWGHADPNLRNLFNDLDPKSHSELRRKVVSAYSMSSLVSYEPYVDECTTTLIQRLSELASSGVAFNMGHWFQCYALEMIRKITVSGASRLVTRFC